MLVLAFDTSSLLGSAGWVRFPAGAAADPREVEGHAEIIGPADPGHAETLIGRLDAALALGGWTLDDVDLLAWCRGPGTFTGLRIGLATAKGLALARELPLVGVGSLEALALGAPMAGVLVPLIDARRGELWGAAYRRRLEGGSWRLDELAPARVLAPDEVLELVRSADDGARPAFLGSGAIRNRERLAALGAVLPADAAAVRPFWTAVSAVSRYRALGGDDLAAVEPVYLRAPDARPPATRVRRVPQPAKGGR